MNDSDSDLSTATVVATIAGAVALLVSGWVHFYLYFRGGYRGIAPDDVLGLTISRGGAEANNGRIYARNRPGHGCIFIIDLPRAVSLSTTSASQDVAQAV